MRFDFGIVRVVIIAVAFVAPLVVLLRRLENAPVHAPDRLMAPRWLMLLSIVAIFTFAVIMIGEILR